MLSYTIFRYETGVKTMLSKPLSCDQSMIFVPFAHLDHKYLLLLLCEAIDCKFLEDKL